MKKPFLIIILILAVVAVGISVISLVSNQGFKKIVGKTISGNKKQTPTPLEIEQLLPELKSKEMLIENLKVSLNTAIEENADMMAEVDSLKKFIDEKDTQISSFKGQLEFFSDENRRLRSDVLAQRDKTAKDGKAFEEERKSLEEALSLGDKKIFDLQQMYQSQAEDLKNEIGGLLLQNSRLQERIQQLNNKNLIKDTAKMHYNLAALYVDKKDFTNAVKEYERALELYPEDADAHYNLAIIADIHLKDVSLAVSHYQNYIRLNSYADNRKEVEDRILLLRMKESVKIGPPLTSQPSESVRKSF